MKHSLNIGSYQFTLHDPEFSNDNHNKPEQSCVRIDVVHATSHNVKPDSFSIFIAGKTFIKPKAAAKNATTKQVQQFYTDNMIQENIDLTKLAHGGDEDTYEKSVPVFMMQADLMHTHLQNKKNILVNCNNGRSRTGSVVAAYLMKHLHIQSKEAIGLVDAALEQRGFEKGTSINIKGTAFKGSYGSWLQQWEREQILGTKKISHHKDDKENEVPSSGKMEEDKIKANRPEPAVVKSTKKLAKSLMLVTTETLSASMEIPVSPQTNVTRVTRSSAKKSVTNGVGVFDKKHAPSNKVVNVDAKLTAKMT